MTKISFADVVHQSITFDLNDPAEKLVLELIDNPWVQRLRDISQTANTRLVYMFSEHSRFGHCLGAAYLACRLVDHLAQNHPEAKDYKPAIVASALLHDIGHLAPGSHIAQKCWFPDLPDTHEEISVRIIQEASQLNSTLKYFHKELPDQICAILSESEQLPPWTWEIISGGGWNVDRGNWCIVDSVLAGVSYGHYNIPALTDSITLSPDKHLALRENRLDAMMHFAVSRHAMYRQVYQHRVLLAADCLLKAIVQRARDLGTQLQFADEVMQNALSAKCANDLNLDAIFSMREFWWRYHVNRWTNSKDKILSDLCQRLINRSLFKTIRIATTDNYEELKQRAVELLGKKGLDPKYYLSTVSTKDVLTGDSSNFMKALLDDGSQQSLTTDPLMNALFNGEQQAQKRWLVLPAEIKQEIGRAR